MPNLPTHLHSLEQQLLDPTTRVNPTTLAQLLTDDFREFGSSGRAFSKPEIIARLASETAEPPTTLTLDHFHCEQLAPTVALVTYRSHRHTPTGVTTSLRSSLWLQTPAGWQLHFHQGTRSAVNPPNPQSPTNQTT